MAKKRRSLERFTQRDPVAADLRRYPTEGNF
jgi:hypothetical protein